MSFYRRIFHTLRLVSIRSGTGRGKYLKNKNIMNHVGENVIFMPRKIPLYPELIRLHDNVRVASNVMFITHDGIHNMLNNRQNNQGNFQEQMGCIEVMENVFIGSNSIIMYNTRIGSNSIIAAGSIVTKDIPENSIVAGVPAKVIGSMNDYIIKMTESANLYPEYLEPVEQFITNELVEYKWNLFENKRG